MGKKIIASYDIDIKSIETKLAELRGALNENAMGGDFTKKLQKEISLLETQLEKVRNVYPGANANQKQIDSYNKKMENLRIAIASFGKGAVDSFDDSDEYIRKNIQSIKEFIDKISEAQSELDKIKEGKGVPKLNVSTRKGETKESVKLMREAAEKGERDTVLSEYASYSKKQNEEIRKLAKTKGKDSEEYKTAVADRENVHAIEKAYLQMADKVVAADKKIKAAQQEETEAIKKAKEVQVQALGNIVQKTGEVEGATKGAQEQIENWSKEALRAEEASRAFDTIEHKLKSLVSAGAIFGFLSRAIKNTISEMLELDKQFNEIAVVSDYSTKEMWNSFDSVNRVAQKFGVETKNVLEVQNLYYHQGKSMAEVNKLTAQTLTLAKITGMDYADATSNLTAVLNAYNIAAEDAVRVTDTIAAMDTNAAISSEELMTALTKTASIAANAGMSLESTEVFLTKMIETTREAPENLGTALKTIIARFGEVKQEVDGEIVEPADINRVDTALKSVGISLKDSAGQIRDLDDVFMELSAVWDDLDRNTQRYIATISAGSRQQSRFIAMMEDYDRTLELVNISQNSAGLGARQLAKSQESLESSINRLKSSVQEFAATWVKAGIIKDFVENVNNLVNAFNKFPPAIQPVVAGLTLFVLKYKILNPLLARYKILSEGFAKGTDTATMAEELAKQSEIDRKVSLKNLIKTLKEAKEKTKELRDETKKLTGENAEAAAVENARSKGDMTPDDEETSRTPKKVTTATKKRVENADPSKKAKKFVEKEAKEETKEEIEEKGEDIVDNVTQSGSKSLIKTLKGGLEKVGKWILGKIPALAGKISAVAAGAITAAVAAAIVAAIAIAYAVWKTQYAASVDDTSKVEKLTEAQNKYNDSLKEYKNLQREAAKYEELRYKKFKTAEQLEEEQSAAQALVEEYPHLLDYIDEEGNYHLKNVEAINAEIQAKKNLMEQSAQTYNQLRVSYANQGIYADKSTAAGATMDNIQSYYSSLGDEGIKDLKKRLDKVGVLDGGSFKKLAEAYAEGEKFSFNHKDFSNLFAGQIDADEFDVLVEKFAETGDIFTALNESGAYTTSQMYSILNVWQELNAATGGLYEQLLMNIGKETKNIYVQQADLFIDEKLGDAGLSQESKQAIRDAYSKIATEQQEKNLSNAEAARDAAIWNIVDSTAAYGSAGITVGAMSANPAVFAGSTAVGLIAGIVDGLINNWEAISTDPAASAAKVTNEYMKTFETVVEGFFAEGGTAQFNEYQELLANTTLKDIKDVFPDNEEWKKLPDQIKQILELQRKNQQQEMLDFKNKVIDSNITYADGGKVVNSDFIENTLNISEIRRFEEVFAQMGAASGGQFLKAYEMALSKGLSNEGKAKFLSMDLTDIDSVVQTMTEFGDTLAYDKELMGELIGAMGGVDAVLFTTIEEGAEKVGERIEHLVSKLERFKKLAAGEGEFADVAAVLEQKFALGDFKNVEDVENFLSSGQISWTSDGAKFTDDSGKDATDLALKSTAIEYSIAEQTAEALEKKERSQEEELQYQSALQTMLVSRQGMEAMLYEEWKADQEGRIKGMEKELEQLKKARDAYEELLKFIQEYDYYQNLNREIDELDFNQQTFQFEIEFSTNVDQVVESTKNSLNNINNQIAANSAGARAAEGNAKIYRDSLSKNYSDYVSFDSSGTLIVDQERMLKLQQDIANAKASGNDETAALLENEKETLEATIKAYEDSMKTSQNYTKNLQNNFKEVEKILKKAYEDRAAAEEKIYEIIKDNEDRELEAVKDKYEAIKEENNKYLESIRKMVDTERRIRDREDSQQDVADKEKKLAMMKMDTSGVYKNQIQQLEKELAGDYRNLEDQAIDDKISELEDEYRAYEETMDKEVEYLENSLEEKRKNYENYQKEVNDILMKGSDEALAWILANDQTLITETTSRQELLRLEYQKTMVDGIAANELIGESLIEDISKNLELCRGSAEGFDGMVTQYSSNTIASNGEISKTVDGLSEDYEGLTDKVDGLEDAEILLKKAVDKVTTATKELESVRSENYQPNLDRIQKEIEKWDDLAASIREARAAETAKNSEKYYMQKDGKYNKFSDKNAVVYQNAIGRVVGESPEGGGYTEGRYEYMGKDETGKFSIFKIGDQLYGVWDGNFTDRYLDESGAVMGGSNLSVGAYYYIDEQADAYLVYDEKGNRKTLEAYATGGFADFTGPAWLDGTKSKPEAVLNPTQTKTFIQFTDALSTLTSMPARPETPTTASQKAGDATYNFTITVDQMSSDYDVDKLIERIQERLNKANQYRNVTMLKKKN